MPSRATSAVRRSFHGPCEPQHQRRRHDRQGASRREEVEGGLEGINGRWTHTDRRDEGPVDPVLVSEGVRPSYGKHNESVLASGGEAYRLAVNAAVAKNVRGIAAYAVSINVCPSSGAIPLGDFAADVEHLATARGRRDRYERLRVYIIRVQTPLPQTPTSDQNAVTSRCPKRNPQMAAVVGLVATPWAASRGPGDADWQHACY